MVVTLDHTPTPNTASARAAAAQEARDVADSLGLPPLVPHGVDEGRPVRVIVIGAGFSGLGAAIYLPQQIRNLSLQVYDRADDIGGVCESPRPPPFSHSSNLPSGASHPSSPFTSRPALPVLGDREPRWEKGGRKVAVRGGSERGVRWEQSPHLTSPRLTSPRTRLRFVLADNKGT